MKYAEANAAGLKSLKDLDKDTLSYIENVVDGVKEFPDLVDLYTDTFCDAINHGKDFNHFTINYEKMLDERVAAINDLDEHVLS